MGISFHGYEDPPHQEKVVSTFNSVLGANKSKSFNGFICQVWPDLKWEKLDLNLFRQEIDNKCPFQSLNLKIWIFL